MVEKTDRTYLKKIRYAFQWGLFALVVYGGWRFYLFTEHFLSGTPLVRRPPLVEGFLPIGSLMSLKFWIITGTFDPVHPAGLAIFLGAIVGSLALKKSFCGWICPVGTLSEALYRAGGKIFGRNFTIHPYLDIPLRSLKYILMAFFLYVVIFQMAGWMILAFIISPYWKVADVKMLRFFTDMGTYTAVTLVALVALSIPFRNFWCRYLCPYGAFVGLLSYASPWKITRNDEACIHCHRCTKNCPSLLEVEGMERVKSPECTGCLTCVANCPSKGALEVATPKGKSLKPVVFAALVAAVFFGIVGAAKLTGHWETAVGYEEYKELIPKEKSLEHP
jgi:polyferredoxin